MYVCSVRCPVKYNQGRPAMGPTQWTSDVGTTLKCR